MSKKKENITNSVGKGSGANAGKGGLLLVVIAGVMLFILYLIGSNSDIDSSSTAIDSEAYLAYNYAEEFVKKELKAPSTAEFPGTFEQPDHITALGNKRYKINSWFDSQNSFGASIRTEFSCIIYFEGDEVKCEGLVLYE